MAGEKIVLVFDIFIVHFYVTSNCLEWNFLEESSKYLVKKQKNPKYLKLKIVDGAYSTCTYAC